MIEIAGKDDGAGIVAVTSHIDVFTREEKDCVTELWQEYIAHGAQASGYTFLVAREAGEVAGYACYGPRSLTTGTFDLFWIAVDPHGRRKGLGRELLAQVEKEVRRAGGRLVFVETSGLEKYGPTRDFYLGTGYTREAVIKDFYAAGDDLVIFTKHVR
ncbi:MAG: GNAT family N-acetyltransferase [Chloroflexi bacterium]|nr:GNAT family N-acetyltransferase [Chloroflexota bacterium]